MDKKGEGYLSAKLLTSLTINEGNLYLVVLKYLFSVAITFHCEEVLLRDTNFNGDDAVLVATHHGHIDVVEWLTQEYRRLISSKPGNNQDLHIWDYFHHKNKLEEKGGKSRTPLEQATLGGHVDLVKYILDPINGFGLKNVDVISAYKIAEEIGEKTKEKNYLEIVRILSVLKDIYDNDFNPKVDLLKVNEKEKILYLEYAIKYQHKHIVEYILQNPPKNNLNPYHLITRYGCAYLSELIASITNIDINEKDKDGYTPLYILLDKLKENLDKNKDYQRSNTVDGLISVIQLMLEKHADPFINVKESNKSNTPLGLAMDLAIQYKSQQIIKVFLENPNVREIWQRSEANKMTLIHIFENAIRRLSDYSLEDCEIVIQYFVSLVYFYPCYSDLIRDALEKLDENGVNKSELLNDLNTLVKDRENFDKWGHQFKNLVFQGGGIKGLAYISAIKKLIETFALSNFSQEEVFRLRKHTKETTLEGNNLDAPLVQKIQAISLENNDWANVEFKSDELKRLKEFLDKKGEGYLSAKLLKGNIIDLSLIERIAGTSAGAIAATLLAVGYTPQEVEDELKDLDFERFLDSDDSKDKERFLELKNKKLANFFMEILLPSNTLQFLKKLLANYDSPYGIFNGEEFRKWIEKKIKLKTERDYLTFGELDELHKENKARYKNLYLIGTNINSGYNQEVIFSYKTTKNMIISDAVRSSMSIPIVFKPHRHYIKQYIKNDNNNHNFIRTIDGSQLYIDGGIMNNYPIDIFDYSKNFSNEGIDKLKDYFFNTETLGLRVIPQTIEDLLDGLDKDVKEPAKFFKDYMALYLAIIFSYYNKDESKFALRYRNLESLRSILINNCAVSTIDFDLSVDQKEQLVVAAKDAVDKYREKGYIFLKLRKYRELNETANSTIAKRFSVYLYSAQSTFMSSPKPLPIRFMIQQAKKIVHSNGTVSIIFTDEKLVTQFQNKLTEEKIYNPGMMGEIRKPNIRNIGNNILEYEFILQLEEYNDLMGKSAFESLLESQNVPSSKFEELEEEKEPDDGKDYAMMGPGPKG